MIINRGKRKSRGEKFDRACLRPRINVSIDAPSFPLFRKNLSIFFFFFHFSRSESFDRTNLFSRLFQGSSRPGPTENSADVENILKVRTPHEATAEIEFVEGVVDPRQRLLLQRNRMEVGAGR